MVIVVLHHDPTHNDHNVERAFPPDRSFWFNMAVWCHTPTHEQRAGREQVPRGFFSRDDGFSWVRDNESSLDELVVQFARLGGRFSLRELIVHERRTCVGPCPMLKSCAQVPESVYWIVVKWSFRRIPTKCEPEKQRNPASFAILEAIDGWIVFSSEKRCDVSEDFGSDAISLEVPLKSLVEYSYRKGDGTSGCEQTHSWWESQDGGCGLSSFSLRKKSLSEIMSICQVAGKGSAWIEIKEVRMVRRRWRALH